MRYSLSHLSDEALLSSLAAVVAQDRATTATLLAHLAEVDERKLYTPAGFTSMYLYCVHALHMSSAVAYKRISAARAAREYPAIFGAVADGRLHISGVNLLAPYLTPESADQLLVVASRRTESEIEDLIAKRYPRTDVLALAQEISAQSVLPAGARETDQLPARGVGTTAGSGQLPARGVRTPARVSPLSGSSVALQVTLDRSTYEKLCYLKQLLGHQIPSGELGQVLARAFDVAIAQIEKRKFAATEKPRACRRSPAEGSHYVPAAVKRAVWERDGGRCTFVSDTGHRCQARSLLEFDHVLEVARGGEATVEGIRLRCRAHNQYTAEQAFGAGFMSERRREASEARARAREERVRAAEARRHAAAEARQREMEARDAEKDPDRSVVPWLRALGYSATQAQSASALCDDIPDAPIEERVKAALSRHWRKTHPRMYSPETGHAAAPA